MGGLKKRDLFLIQSNALTNSLIRSTEALKLIDWAIAFSSIAYGKTTQTALNLLFYKLSASWYSARSDILNQPTFLTI